jgi:hypothetical protein
MLFLSALIHSFLFNPFLKKSVSRTAKRIRHPHNVINYHSQTKSSELTD